MSNKTIALVVAIQCLIFIVSSYNAQTQPMPENVLVIDAGGGTNGRGQLFEVNLNNGNRNLISDFGNMAQGELGSDPFGVLLDGSNKALVVDQNAGLDFRGALFSVDSNSGDRIVISDFGNIAQGAIGSNPSGLVFLITNPITVESIPTFGKSGLIVMAGILGLVGFIAMRKKYTMS